MTPIGHFAVGFALKRFVPKVNIAVLLLSTWIIDVVFMIFAITGVEGMENLKNAGSVPSPLSHSLFMAIVWSALTAIVVFLITKNKKTTIVLFAATFSHWLLDFFVWSNQNIFFGGSPQIGLGLYDKYFFKMSNGSLYSLFLELGLLIVGVILYINFLIKNKKKEKV